MKKIKCVVIGVGNMGKHHARNFSEINDCTLVAVSDTNQDVGLSIAQKYNCKYYKNYKEMLKKEEFEIASIATPISSHFEIARNCILAKKNLLIEKPICLSTKEAKLLIALANKKNIKLSVGYVERFNPAIVKLKKLIDKGSLGEIKSMIFRRIGPPPVQNIGTNIIMDIGVHDINLANFLLNEIPQKAKVFWGKTDKVIHENFADIYLVYKTASAHIQVNWITPVKIRELMINFSKGYAEVDFIRQRLFVYPLDEIYDNKIFFRFSVGVKKIISIKKSEPLKEELKSFIKSVKFNKKPLVSADESFETLKIALKLAKSQN